jgi:hypothetical protein
MADRMMKKHKTIVSSELRLLEEKEVQNLSDESITKEEFLEAQKRLSVDFEEMSLTSNVTGLSVTFDFNTCANEEIRAHDAAVEFYRQANECFMYGCLSIVETRTTEGRYQLDTRADVKTAWKSKCVKWVYKKEEWVRSAYCGFTVLFPIKHDRGDLESPVYVCPSTNPWKLILCSLSGESVESQRGSVYKGTLKAKMLYHSIASHTEGPRHCLSYIEMTSPSALAGTCLSLVEFAKLSDRLADAESSSWSESDRTSERRASGQVYLSSARCTLQRYIEKENAMNHHRYTMSIYGISNIAHGREIIDIICTRLEQNWNVHSATEKMGFPAVKVCTEVMQQLRFRLKDAALIKEICESPLQALQVADKPVSVGELVNLQMDIDLTDPDEDTRCLAVSIYEPYNSNLRDVKYYLTFWPTSNANVTAWITPKNVEPVKCVSMLRQVLTESFEEMLHGHQSRWCL